MANPTIRIHNTETDEIIDREMTDDELAAHNAANEASKIEIDAINAEILKRETLEAKLLAL